MTTTLEPIIRQHPFFEGLEDHHLSIIVGCAKNVKFEEKEMVFQEGDDADWFYLIREGMVAIQIVVPQKGSTTVQTVEEGDVVGWSWLFPPYKWQFDVRALQQTRALAFDAKCLRTKCDADHDLGYELFRRFSRIVTDRLEATRLQLMDLYGSNT